MTGMQIGTALLLLTFLILLWPQAKYWLKNSPEPREGDWTAVALPIVGVVLFVMLLMNLV